MSDDDNNGTENKRGCDNCAYSHSIQSRGPEGPLVGQTQLVCMRMPPQIVLLSQQTPLGEQNALISQFPPVDKSFFCYEWTPEPPDAETENGTLEADDGTDIVTGDKINRD